MWKQMTSVYERSCMPSLVVAAADVADAVVAAAAAAVVVVVAAAAADWGLVHFLVRTWTRSL